MLAEATININMMYKLGIDVGGTFTDFALVNEKTGTMAIYKQLTTPHDPSECVLDGACNILAAKSASFDRGRASHLVGQVLVAGRAQRHCAGESGGIQYHSARAILQV